MTFITQGMASLVMFCLLLASVSTDGRGCRFPWRYCAPPPPSPLPPREPPPPPVTCLILLYKLRVCAPHMKNFRGRAIPKRYFCCIQFSGLFNAQAKVCACAAGNLRVLSYPISIPRDIAWLLTSCRRSVPANFSCSVS